MKFDFGGNGEETAEEVDFSGQESLGKCPRCGSGVFDHGMSYTCEKAVGGARSCDFKTGKIILKRPIEREQVAKLLVAGRTDLLPKFISKKGRPFSAYLVMGAGGKVGFEFEPRKAKAAAETKTVKPKSRVSVAKKSAARKA